MTTRDEQRRVRPERAAAQPTEPEEVNKGKIKTRTPPRRPRSGEPEAMSMELVEGWHSLLVEDEEWLSFWADERGVLASLLKERMVGVQAPRSDAPDNFRYTIPVFDAGGELVDVKKYAPGAADKKNIHTRGHGRPCRLYGADWLADADPASDVVWIVGGEPDALRGMSEGLLACTGTSGEAALPRTEDLELLREFQVNVCLDMDDPGRAGAAKWSRALLPIARDVRNVSWPADQGKDLTDWLNNGHTVDELAKLAHATLPARSKQRPTGEWLDWAINKRLPLIGSRNQAGFDLACQLRDDGYPQEDAERVLVESFVPAVAELDGKDHEYTEDEARATVESVYSQPARDPAPGVSRSTGGSGKQYELNDAGNADLLLDLHGPDMRFVREVGRNGTWFAWTGHGWAAGEAAVNDFARDVAGVWRQQAGAIAADGDKEATKVADRLRAHATRSGNDSALRAMLRQASLREGVAVPLETFEADPSLLPFHNEVVVLGADGVSSRPHDRDDYSRTVARVEFDPAATSPQWSAFLDLFVPVELQPYLQKLVGYSLYGNNNERLLIFLMGPSSTGKSTFIELLARALGRGVVSTFNLSLFRDKGHDAPRPDVLAALARRVIYTSEASTDWKLHADHVKRMTGFDHVQARGMAKDEMVEAIPRFTPWVVTNNPPTIEHADPALWKRLVVVPFTNVIAADRDNVAFRTAFPTSELPGVVAWAVAGWAAYVAEGLAERPEAVREATARLQRSLSTLDQFLDECCEFAPTDHKPPRGEPHPYTVPAGALYKAYCGWWEESGLPERDRLASNKFGEMLEARGFVWRNLRDPASPRTDDRKVRTRIGLRLDTQRVAVVGSGAFRFRMGGA